MATKVVNGNGKLHGVGRSNGSANHPGQSNNGKTAGNAEVTLVSNEITRLVEASKDGRLTERAKPEQFTGVYREMMQGVNEMLDAILLPLERATAFWPRSPTAK